MFIGELLTNLAAFFEVVKFLLLPDLCVFVDLHLESLGMLDELLPLLLGHLSLSLVQLFLGVDDFQEFISFLFCFESQSVLFDLKLHFSSLVQVFQKAFLFVDFQLLSLTSVSFTFFESSLGPRSRTR